MVLLPVPAARTSPLLRYLLTLACAGGAGVHAALVQPHLEEAGPPLAAAFAAAAAALLAAALAVRQPRHDRWAPACAASLLTAIAACYLLSRTTGLPLLVPEPEHPDPLGMVTTVAELAGAVAGALLIPGKDTR